MSGAIVALLSICVAMGLFIAYKRHQMPPSDTVGQQLNLPVLVDAKLTIFVVIRDGCHFCEQSMPFYRSLVHAGAKLAFVSPDPVHQTLSTLENAGIHAQTVFQLQENIPGLYGTPTIMVVDRKRIVLREYRGRLSHNLESAVISEIVHQ